MSDSGSTAESAVPPGSADSGDSAASAAAQAASQTAGVAAEQSRNVASTAGEQAKAVVSEAKTQAASVAGDAREQVSRVVGDASTELRQQLEQRLTQLAHSARGTAGELRALHEGRTEETGRAGDLTRQASDKLHELADRADHLGVNGVTDEMARFARQRPMMFLGGAAAAGFFAGRMLRNAKAADEDSGTSSGMGQDRALPSSAGGVYDPLVAGRSPAELGVLDGPTGAVMPDETGLGVSGTTGVPVPGSGGPATGPGGIG